MTLTRAMAISHRNPARPSMHNHLRVERRRISSSAKPGHRERILVMANTGLFEVRASRISQCLELTLADTEGMLVSGYGALFPPGYDHYPDSRLPWICPIRSCRKLFANVMGLG